MNLEERVKALEEWRDHIAQALMYAPKKQSQPKVERKMPVGDIAMKFPEDLRQHLTIKPDTIKTEFVSRDKWAAMNAIAVGLGYKYVSEGKNSRWQK